mgnify:CR=1 FL=1
MKPLLRRAVRFVAVGVLNTAVGLLTMYALMYVADVGPLPANAAGYAVGFLLGFALNRRWTFEARATVHSQLAPYMAVIAGAYLVNLGLVFVLTRDLRMNAYLAQLAGMAVYTPLAFLGCHVWVFRHKAGVR